ncbi:MAG: hypothetical protein ABEL51_07720 [Salinibacter sp.]
MGKYVILVVVASLGVWGLSMAQLQGDQQAAEDKADHYHNVLARQVARSGLSVIRARAAQASQEHQCPADILDAVSSVEGTDQSGEYEGGQYEAWLEPVASINHTLRAVSEGTYNGKTAQVQELVEVNVPTGGFLYAKSGGSNKMAQYPGGSGGGSNTPPNIRAMGPLEVDLDGDGKKEIPYVRKSNAKIEMIDPDADGPEDAQTLVNANYNGNKEPAASKTKLAVGRWGDGDDDHDGDDDGEDGDRDGDDDGGSPSVFYANSNNDAIYQVSWEPNSNGKNQSEPQKVAGLTNSRNGAQAVIGIADVNEDEGEELVFADGSQQLRYIDEPGNGDREDGSAFPKIQGGSVGSNNGIGAGAFVDRNNDGTSSVVFVNGSNNIRIVNDAGTNRTIHVDNANEGNGPGAAKVPPAVTDVDGDGNLEVIYVKKGTNKVQHVDLNPENPGQPEVKTIQGQNAPNVKQGPGLQATDMTSPCGGNQDGGGDDDDDGEEGDDDDDGDNDGDDDDCNEEDGNKGHGNDCDGHDEDNPGNSEGPGNGNGNGNGRG